MVNICYAKRSRHLTGGIKVIIYHGSQRPKDLHVIQDSDIVITTYNTLALEYQKDKEQPALLHLVGWYRVVLDEGKSPTILPKQVLSTNRSSPHYPPFVWGILPILLDPPRQLSVVFNWDPHPEQTCRPWHPLRLYPRRTFQQGLCLPQVDRNSI